MDVSVYVKVKNSERQRLLCLYIRAFIYLLKQCDLVLGSSELVNATPLLHINKLVNAAAYPLK